MMKTKFNADAATAQAGSKSITIPEAKMFEEPKAKPNAYLTPEEMRLLKAAPALLEALRDCLGYLESDDDTANSTVAQAARAALAQVEGRVS